MGSKAIWVIARVCTIRGRSKRLGLAGEESIDGSGELVAAVEELKLEDEDEAEQVTAHLLNHLAASESGATCTSSVNDLIYTLHDTHGIHIPVAMISSTTMTF